MNGLTERLEIRVEPDTLAALDEWRKEQPGLPSRGDAIRRLIEAGRDGSGGNLHFSKAQLLIVHMLCDLMKSSKAHTEFDPDFISKALLGGHHWALEWQHQFALTDYVDSPETVTQVVNILDMWSFIEEACEKLGKKERVQIREVTAVGNMQFVGFDGNNESEHMGVAQFLTREMDRFSRFKKRDLNSPSRRLAQYLRMYRVFEPMRKTLVGAGLSEAQLIEIFGPLKPSKAGK